MSDATSITAVSVRCMDKRHTDKTREAIENVVGHKINVYELTDPSGAGVIIDLFGPEAKEWLLKKIDVAVNKLHCSEIYLSVHGTSKEDEKPCGGYVLNGYTDEFSTPEKSRAFLSNELKKAADIVKSRLPNNKVRAFYITFAANGANIVEEVQV